MHWSKLSCTMLISLGTFLAGCNRDDGGDTAANTAIEQEKDEDSTPQPPKVTVPEADFTVTTAALADEFAKDAAAAGAKYKNKTVRVTGDVLKSGKEEGTEVFVLSLKGNDSLTVECGIPADIVNKAQALKVDSPATVQGMFNDIYDDNLSIIMCEIVE